MIVPNTKILVTGGTGLVGSHLLQALVQSGYKNIAAIYRSQIPPVDYKDQVTWLQCELEDIVQLETIMQGVEQVYHCAAVVSFNPKQHHQMLKVNVEGTTNIVNAALTNNVAKLCYVSSVAALGRIRKGEEVNESMNWTPATSNSEYGKSKHLAEMEVWRGISEGLQGVIVNPSIILGSGDWNKSGSSKLFKSAYNSFPWYTNGVSGFIDVVDVVRAMIQLMNSDISGERFILNGANYPYKQLFTDIAACFGKQPPTKLVSPILSSLIWRWEAAKSAITGNDPLLTKETTLTAQAKVYYSNEKIRKALPGFTFTPIQESISRICQELKHKYNL